MYHFRLSSLIVVLLCVMISFAGNAQDKLWEKDLQPVLGQTSWIQQSNDGVIIASGNKGLLGLNNNTGEVLWHHKDLKNINRSTFYVVDGLPIFHVQYQSLQGKKRSLLLNSTSGKILFDTKEEALMIGKSNLLPQISCILFEVRKGRNNKLLLFNYKDSKVKWIVDMGEGGGLLKAMKSIAMGQQGFLEKSPILIEKSHLLITEKDKVTVIDINAGEKTWAEEFAKNVKSAVYSSIDKKVYVGEKSKLRIFEANSGKDVSNKKIKLTGALVSIFLDSKKNIVVVDAGGFNLLDPKKGEFIWKKSAAISCLYDVIEIDNYYYGIGTCEKSSMIMKVNAEGKKEWKQGVGGAIYYTQPIESGLFYLSSERSNILTYDEGEDIWKKDVKFKAIPAVGIDKESDEVVFYSKKTLYKFNLKTGQLDLLNKDIKFEKSSDAIFFLEVRPSGYFINSSQHVSFFDKTGKNNYLNYYKSVGTIHGWERAADIGVFVATGVDLDIEGSMQSIQDLKTLSRGGSIISSVEQTGAGTAESLMVGGYIDDVPVFEVTKKRYFNSKNVKDAKFILTTAGEGNRVIRVNKETGKITHQIQLVDKTPNYVVDEIDSRVFVCEQGKVLTCYYIK